MSGYNQTKNNKNTYNNQSLEVVITCVDYGDFLDQTLPFTLSHVDRVVVVTSFDDELTKKVCQKWSVECVPTDAFTEKGEIFNKGSAINVGLSMLRQNGWILHMDADIVLPLTTRNMLSKSALNTNSIYGCNRLNVVGWDEWQKLKSSWHDVPQFEHSCIVNTPPHYSLGGTLVHKHYGYMPIGFFQLWHSSYMNKHLLRYPDVNASAEKDDVQWAMRWTRKNRVLLPTIRVFHLESEESKMGSNWRGRKTKPFTASGKMPEITDSLSYGY